MRTKRRIIYCYVPSTPTTSRTGFMRNRRRSTPHMVTYLRQAGIAKELKQFEHDEQPKTSSSSKEPRTPVASTSQPQAQMNTDDSGIDLKQESPIDGHRYFLRRRCKIAYY